MIQRSRYAIIQSLSCHPTSSIQSVYQHILHLHIIQDIEAGYTAQKKDIPYAMVPF